MLLFIVLKIFFDEKLKFVNKKLTSNKTRYIEAKAKPADLEKKSQNKINKRINSRSDKKAQYS